MTGAGAGWAAAVLAGAAGLLAALGAFVVLADGIRLPGVLRAAARRAALEVGETARVVRGLGASQGPLSRGIVVRLRVAGAVGAAAAAWIVLGVRAAAAFAVAGAWAAPRFASVRRARHGRRLDEHAASAARAIADAVAGGVSIRRSVTVAARRLGGPIAQELRRTSWELEMGAVTEAALERLRVRSGSRGVGLIVAAMHVQRRAGGDLPRVLRDVAGALEEEQRVLEEARAATAQARFTAAVVIALPLFGIAIGALASPGLPSRLTGTAVGAGLLGTALALQVCGVLAIRRLAAPCG